MKILFSVMLSIFLFAPSIALAQYDVCGTLTFFDTRTDRSNVSGSKLTWSTYNTNQPLRWSKIHLYDQDGCNDYNSGCSDGGNDDFLATTYTNSSGEFCFTGIGGAEDVYLVFEFESHDGQVKWGQGWTAVAYSHTIWNIGGDISNMNFSATCFTENDGECSNRAKANEYPVTQGMANMLAAIIDVDRWTSYWDLRPNGHNRAFTGYYGDRPGSATCPAQGTSWGQDEFCVVTSASDDNHVVVHELAHNLHRRYLDITGSLAGSCPGDWIGAPNDSEKCAMSEGWASFFATAIYFWPTAQVPLFRIMTNREVEGDTAAGNVIPNQGPTPMQCASMIEGGEKDQEANITRFFWDIHDSTTIDDDGSDNNARQTLSTLMRVWDDFDGGSMPDPQESGSNGRNIYDYKYAATHGTYSFGPNLATEISHNCLSGSQPY